VPPRTVGPYEVLSLAGRGGIGTVYRARDRRTGTLAAVKLLAPAAVAAPSAARRLAREFEALRSLDHPNVVRVLEAGVCGGYSFLAMELVDGLDLRSYLSPTFEPSGLEPCEWCVDAACAPASFGDPDAELLVVERGTEAILAFADRCDEPDTADGDAPPAEPRCPFPLPVEREQPPPPSTEMIERLNEPDRVERLRRALAQVCAGLDHVHGRGLVHRDVKPPNIMVDARGRVRLMDFGLVKCANEDDGALDASRKVVGTYRYMAPEQARGLAVDGRADLYSLGVVLFELLCGRPPFLAEHPAELWEEITSRPPPSVATLNAGADARLASVAERLLRKDPDARPQRASDVLDEIA
jgi:serine/threonine protein kinase